LNTIVGIRFKKVGKTYYFNPKDFVFEAGQYAIVETARGVEIGEVVMPNKQVPDEEIVAPLKEVIRPATPEDLEKHKQAAIKEKNAFDICLKKIEEHKLDMKLIDAEYTFDNNKVLFYFSADGRVDFRDLVKDLANIFKVRIELRQIGVRDEAKMLGGIGICGQQFCCSRFLSEFIPVSIKMAKEQGHSLNPSKISGSCGRLMCCLKYEQEVYEDLIETTPIQGSVVKTPDGVGTVIDVNLLRGILKVRLNDDETIVKYYNKNQVNTIKKGKIDLEIDENVLKELEE